MQTRDLTNDEVLNRVKHSPEFRDILTGEEKRMDEEHADAGRALERATQDHATRRPALIAARDTTVSKVRAAEHALQSAVTEAVAAERAVANLDAGCRAAAGKALARLRATAPIDEILEVRRQLDQLRRGSHVLRAVDGVRQCDELVTSPMARSAIRAQLEEILTSMPRDDDSPVFEPDITARPTMFEKVTAKVLGGKA